MAAELNIFSDAVPHMSGDSAGPLLDFQINGTPAFSDSPLSAAFDLVEEASALLKVMAAARSDADELEVNHGKGILATMEGASRSRALDGLHSLTALAAFFIEQHRRAQ